MEDLNRFLVKFGLNTKIVVNKEFESIYEDVKKAYKNIPHFPENFIIEFEEKEFGNLDSPIHLMNRQSNVLTVVENDTQQKRLEEPHNSPRST